MLIDSNVIIDLFRGVKLAKRLLKHSRNIKISVLSCHEVVSGMKSKKEIGILTDFLKTNQISVLQLNRNISVNSYEIFKDKYFRQNIGIVDSLISATAIHYHEPLYTQNIKHFRNIKDLKIIKPYFYEQN